MDVTDLVVLNTGIKRGWPNFPCQMEGHSFPFSLRNDITGRISPVLETAFSEQRFCSFFFYDINSIPVSYFVTIKRERKRKRQVKKGRTETEKKRRPK